MALARRSLSDSVSDTEQTQLFLGIIARQAFLGDCCVLGVQFYSTGAPSVPEGNCDCRARTCKWVDDDSIGRADRLDEELCQAFRHDCGVLSGRALVLVVGLAHGDDVPWVKASEPPDQP